MNVKTIIKQPAPRDSTRYLDRYLNELIDFGGIPTTRAEAIREMLADGMSQPNIDRWLQGYELGCRIRARRDRQQLELKISIAPSARSTRRIGQLQRRKS